MWKRDKKPIVGVFGFSGCAGDQLSILHMEDELVDFFTSAEIKFFHMAQSHQEVPHVDIALIEGSINTDKQLEELKEIREKADIVVAIGTCACVGGLQYLPENSEEFAKRFEAVYGKDIDKEQFTVGKAMPAQPIDKFIEVDYYIPGCPISKESFIPIYTKLISGIQPAKYPYPVCVVCKYKENDCLLTKGQFCAGPVTAAGCNAICPSLNLPCVGCFGPYEEANYASLVEKLKEIGLSEDDAKRKLGIYGGAIASKILRGEKK